MADIKIRLELNENANEEKIGEIKTDNLTFASSSIDPNVNGVFENMPSRDNVFNGINALTFGQELYFNENGMLDNTDNMNAGLDSDNLKKEIVWGIVNFDNSYSVKITFENAINLKDIVVYGDKKSNQFPVKAVIDGVTKISNDDYIWAIQFENESNTHTIEFTHWNRANYNAVITFIGVMLKYIEIDKTSGLKSVESLSQSTGQPKDIYYGIVPSSGELKIIDIHGEIQDLITEEIIPNSNLNIEVFANGKKVQQHISNNSEYSRDRIFSIEVSNKLDNLQNVTYGGFKNEEITKTLYDILIDGLKTIGYNDFTYIENVMLGQENAEYLKSIIYPSPYLPVMSFREFIDKVCEIAQLTLTQNDNGDLVFINSKPLNSVNDYIIIPTKMQKSLPFKNVIVNNKVERVEYVNSNFKRDVNKTVNTYTNDNTFIKPFTEDTITVTNSDYYLFSGESMGQPLTQGVRIETFVTTGSFEIIDQSIQEISDFDFSVFGKVFTNPSFMSDPYTYPSYWKDSTNSLISNMRTVFNDVDSGVAFSDKLTEVSITFNKLEDYVSKTLKLSHNNSITFNKISDGKWQVNYSILTSTGKYYWYGTNYYPNETIGEFKSVEKLIISAKGNQWVIDFVDNVVKVGNENSSLYRSLNKNELLQDNATYNGVNIGNVIANNILNIYNKGLANVQLQVVCGDYYNSSGQLVKNWSKGDIIQIGDIVRIDKDNKGTSLWRQKNGEDMYFKVVGRNFRYSGVPTIDLELQEVKIVN